MTSHGMEDYVVGYGKPPEASRFAKGRSGNPRGRPRGIKSQLPYDTVLGQMVTIREEGVERRVTAAEAFLLYITKRGLEGDGGAARAAMLAIEAARTVRRADLGSDVRIFVRTFAAVGSISDAITGLCMARKLRPFSAKPRLALEPWMVQAALDRLGERRLTIDEQATVVAATRTPHRVKWPQWWEIKTLAAPLTLL